ncbi:UDPGP type 1 family protein [candidate division KSB1 bacterium]|nr:UDPGP type 1 family protein [candidate division KSB1 bacterium]
MRIVLNNIDEQKIIDAVYDAGQGHVFRFWNELGLESRTKLLTQLGKIDLELVNSLNQKFVQSTESLSPQQTLEPADFISLPKTPDEVETFNNAKKIGEKALKAGRVAAFLVAGGQGTRLGFDGPKGSFPVTPIKKKSLFQLHAEKILAISTRHGSIIPWYIMTSETNHQQTVDFFESKSYFGLQPQNVMLFKQEMIPALDDNGRLILDAKDNIFRNPNGHGGSLSALKNSGALQDLKKRGADLIFYFQVDNVLTKICDPIFLGFHILKKAEMSAKIVPKTDPEEKVGVLGKIDGRLGVIEYSDLPAETQTARNSDGTLKFRAGNIATHILDVDFVEKENKGGLRLPWHLAHKKIPYLNDTGELVHPSAPNGYKFETFVFDALADAERAVFLEVKRENEFSPVKNADGNASPATARRDMINQFGSWLEKAGVSVRKDTQGNVQSEIEITPLFAMDAKELAEKVNSDLSFDGSLYLV